uniref:Uncharacterized protein n=1 Tax=Ananas comosus var. bracteatus TaxID=296719 RepID=A0A6V7Q6A8_ANACO|nr:unnamed protein product [Ananas comosus var. bracteatus]
MASADFTFDVRFSRYITFIADREQRLQTCTIAENLRSGRPKPSSGRPELPVCTNVPIRFLRPRCAAPVTNSGGPHLPPATCQHNRYSQFLPIECAESISASVSCRNDSDSVRHSLNVSTSH